MSVFLRLFVFAAWMATNVVHSTLQAANTFSIASYNLENYLIRPAGGRVAKSETSKAKIREGLLKLNAEILALQEIGGQDALQELRSLLRADGLDYPHWEYVSGSDTNIHVGILSKFPISARRPHTNEGFLLHGRRFRISRGIADVDVRVNTDYKLTVLVAHLKSRREVPEADQAELREHEATLLRRFIDERLDTDPSIHLAVVGDFNDTRNSRSVRLLMGHGARALVDTRPAERNGDNNPVSNGRLPPRNIAWTHYYAIDESYSRIDYILVNRRMARDWDRIGTYVLTLPDWGLGSDHRPIIARFHTRTD